MNAFEFVFSLFGLLLGLSLVEVLAGLVRTIKSRKVVRVGWLTPLLGVLMMLHLTTFWDDAWRLRDQISVNNVVLYVGLIIAGVYYYAASFVFPDKPDEWPDLDDHYHANKKYVLGGIILCQLISTHASMALTGRGYSLSVLLSWSIFVALFAAPIFVKGRKKSAALLAVALTLFVLGAVASSF